MPPRKATRRSDSTPSGGKAGKPAGKPVGRLTGTLAGKPAERRISRSRRAPSSAPASEASLDSIPEKVAFVLQTLERLGSARVRDDMAGRFGITGKTASTAFGVPMPRIQKLAKELRVGASKRPGAASGPLADIDDVLANHRLSIALWRTGQYDARMVAVYMGEPRVLTPDEMDVWAAEMDNWAICDTACFHLFDRSPHALRKVRQWSSGKLARGIAPPADDEFVRRAAFALLASVALHDKTEIDDRLLALLPLAERGVTDPPDSRNFVIKGVSWALRSAARRSPELRRECEAIARRLADSAHPGARWTGKDVLRQLGVRSSIARG